MFYNCCNCFFISVIVYLYRCWFRLPTFAFVVVFHCCCCLIDVVHLLLLFFNKCCCLFVQMLVLINNICICCCCLVDVVDLQHCLREQDPQAVEDVGEGWHADQQQLPLHHTNPLQGTFLFYFSILFFKKNC